MDEKMTMEITNDRLEEAIKQYAAERTKENLTTVLNLLRPTKLYVPAMLKAPDQPTPCFLKNNKGEQFFVAYTSKEQMPEEPKSQALLFMPFPACNNIVVKMTPQQFNVFVKKQVEFGVLPKRLYAEGETFVRKLCEEREAFVNQIFAETYKEPKLYPYTEADYSVMALDIAEDLTLIRVDLPEKALAAPLCYRIYITFNPQTKKAGYYTIEMTAEKEVRALGQILPDGRHESLGEAPVEGAELQKIMDLARYDGTEMTS